MSNRHAAFKALFQMNRRYRIPGAYDALSAKLVEEAGFETVYVGSYGTAASCFSFPDVGLLSLDELVQHAARVAAAVKVPVVADAEGGFHSASNIWRTVAAFERSGVSAIHIEDHAGKKHTDLPQRLIPLEEMLGKLRAAKEAKHDPAFQIIARTDAIWATHDEAEAYRRVKAFVEAGADMVFPTGASGVFVEAIRAQYTVPIVGIESRDDPKRPDGETPDLVLNYAFCLNSATAAMKKTLGLYRDTGDIGSVRDDLETVSEFEKRSDYASFSARVTKFEAS